MGRSRMIQLAMGMVIIGLIAGIVVLAIQVSNCNETGSPITCDPDTTTNPTGTQCVSKIECDTSTTTRQGDLCVGNQSSSGGGGGGGGGFKLPKPALIAMIVLGVICAVIAFLAISKRLDKEGNRFGAPYRAARATATGIGAGFGNVGGAIGDRTRKLTRKFGLTRAPAPLPSRTPYNNSRNGEDSSSEG